MIRLRPYNSEDAMTILSWCKDEKAYYQWTAGALGVYPITLSDFAKVESLMPFTAFDETGMVGFFIMRNPTESTDIIRFGFVIVDPDKRGAGYGKAMLKLGLKFAFEIYGAKKVTLGVFENNANAYQCYKSIGFRDIVPSMIKKYDILGEEWQCKDLIIER